MTVKNIHVEQISEYENNPRNNEKAVGAVAKSIEAFGFKVPIVIDSDGVIVAGHTRFKAAKLLGMKEIPCVIANDLSKEQVTAFRLVDNKTAELAAWDFVELENELRELAALGVGMEVFGFGYTEPVDDIDDSFFDLGEDDSAGGEPKRIKCEHCGEWFEI